MVVPRVHTAGLETSQVASMSVIALLPSAVPSSFPNRELEFPVPRKKLPVPRGTGNSHATHWNHEYLLQLWGAFSARSGPKN